ncbi:MAG: hypothetical protein PHP37_03525 [Patescibacteria group bacterium]|nr:hypothetical protein [Patescibacteria group bacterium]
MKKKILFLLVLVVFVLFSVVAGITFWEIVPEKFPWPERVFFWILMLLAGYCLGREMGGIFEGKKDWVSLIILFVPLAFGAFFGVYLLEHLDKMIWAILALLTLTGITLLFRLHFLWFAEFAFTYVFFLLFGIKTGQHHLIAEIFFLFLAGIGLHLVINFFLLAKHYRR